MEMLISKYAITYRSKTWEMHVAKVFGISLQLRYKLSFSISSNFAHLCNQDINPIATLTIEKTRTGISLLKSASYAS